MAFTVATYNVLADSYMNPAWYAACSPAACDRSWRHPALARHVEALGADVVCMQEVEADVHAAMAAHMRPLGYNARHLVKGGGKPDGCSTLVRGSAFRVTAVKAVRYHDGAGGRDSGHVGLLNVLRLRRRALGVANTHLKWDAPGVPVEAQIGARQITELLEEIRRMRARVPSWIVCGDLNAEEGSEVVRRLEEVGLASAHRGRSVVTCNSNRRGKRIDHLFHTPDLEAWPIDPPPLRDDTPLPSADQPSDHLALAARFDWSDA